MEDIKPRDNPYLIGHEIQEKLVLEAWKKHSLHQAIMISGPKGIGKATFAYRIARFLLNADESKAESYNSLEIAADSQVFRQITANSHPNFKLLERGYIKTDRQKIYKAIASGNYMDEEELSELKKSAEIVVDDVREVNDFLAKKSANGNWRIVLIDCADEMNRSSANAILKILEEPPARTLLLLVSHNPSRLLPTIRSRCEKLDLMPLTDSQVASLLRRYRSELTEAQVKKISVMAEGSIGRAISFADGNAVDFYDQISRLAALGNNFKIAEMLQFCENAAQDENYELFKELLIKFLTDKVRGGVKVEEYATIFTKAMGMFRKVESLNMDKKQVVMMLMIDLTRVR